MKPRRHDGGVIVTTHLLRYPLSKIVHGPNTFPTGIHTRLLHDIGDRRPSVLQSLQLRAADSHKMEHGVKHEICYMAFINNRAS